MHILVYVIQFVFILIILQIKEKNTAKNEKGIKK